MAEIYKLSNKRVLDCMLKDFTESVEGFSKYTDDTQKTLILNALLRNTVMEEIRNQINFILEEHNKNV